MTSKKHLDKRKQRRFQLEFDEDVKAAIRELSIELGVSQSQIVQFFVLTGLSDFHTSKSTLSRYLEPSDAPMWQYRINFERLKRDLGFEE